MAFAVLIAFAASKVGKVFARVSRVELWARRATGGIFLGVGIYFTLAYTLGVLTHR
jgi:threonine/homoserine/homoserine lactone efflux protein